MLNNNMKDSMMVWRFAGVKSRHEMLYPFYRPLSISTRYSIIDKSVVHECVF